ECNFAPAFMREFLEACHRRDLDGALELFGRRRRYRDLFRDGLRRGLPMYTPWAKAAMELLGLPVGKPRLPHEPLSPEALHALRARPPQPEAAAAWAGSDDESDHQMRPKRARAA